MMLNGLHLIVMMIVAGCLGGLTNFLFVVNLENKRINYKSINISILLGIVASLLVPLFLNTLESKLVDDLTTTAVDKNINNILIFFGFCLLAAISSRSFIQSLSNKILQKLEEEAKETKEELKSKKDEIQRLSEEVESSRKIRFAKFIQKSGNTKEALRHLRELTKKYPDNIEALISLCNCLFDLGMEENNPEHINQALKINEEIIQKISNFEIENFEFYRARCLYNKAAYKLAFNHLENKNIPEDEIKKYLKECFKIFPGMIKYALKDKDFKSIRDFAWFQELTNINYIDNFLEETKYSNLELEKEIIGMVQKKPILDNKTPEI